ncbi:DUF885 domain-containing protein [Marinagarivorans algicola]|uniref:DUF885 domain-containing protein n=1 Tax=Marinagarivorans algicola TaxID=1513270 RepID=UPI0006B66999|nr:DUF885 domain-containing protein [Marinagarivorans algicola]
MITPQYTLKAAISLIALSLTAGCGTQPIQNEAQLIAPATSTQQVNQYDVQAQALFETIFEENVALSPIWQTYLGRSTNQDKWDDLSPAHAERQLALSKTHLSQLNKIDAQKLSPAVALSYRLQKAQLQESIEDYQWRYHGYPINQMFGSHSQVPSLLINQQRISTITDAQNYIARLNAIPKFFEQQIDDLKVRERLGIIAPKFVFEHVIRDSKNLLIGQPFTQSAEQSTLLADFDKKINDAGFTPAQKTELLQQANSALKLSVAPAYQNLVAYLEQLSKKAEKEGGAWKMPDGEAFYNNALARTTTTNLTADDIHRIGLEDVQRIHKEMTAIKDAVNFDGDLAEFFVHMRTSPQFVYAENEEGKAKYLKETTAYIDAMQKALPTVFNILPKAPLKVKAVEPFREKSAGKAFYQAPAPDGSRPGIYYVNLYSLKNMPWYQMEALAFHEALPGHHMQIAISQELEGIPKFRKFGGYTAYIEGWGLYSEYLPKEMGFYKDPYSDFGRLAMELWRSCRLVVDTGVHAKKWTKQQAIDFLKENTPNPVNDIERAVERYLVMPSQATAYKVGMIQILELRKAAQKALGDDFDIRGFHDAVLKNGALPLSVLTQEVEAWVESVRR